MKDELSLYETWILSSTELEHGKLIEQALKKAVWTSLKPVALALALLYAVFAVSHMLLLPASIKMTMASVAGGTAAALLCVAFVTIRIPPVEKLAYPIAFSIVALASLNSSLHVYLSRDLLQTTNIILVIFGTSFFVLSTTWFFAALSLVLASWALAVLGMWPQPDFAHFGFAVFSATLVSILFHFIHVRGLRDNHRLRLMSEHQRLEVEYLATHDYLTDLANRRQFFDRLALAVSHSKRSGRKVAVLFCDLDEFKALNDTFGHDFGDEVLKSVANALRSTLRETDVPARFGGDEFAVLVTHVRRRQDVDKVISKIHAACAAIRFIGKDTRVRLSIGAALFPDDTQNIDQLLERADREMYKAKQTM